MTAVAPYTQRTQCPKCHSDELEPIGVVQGIRCKSCEWEGLAFVTHIEPMPTPKPKFVVTPYENDPEDVGLVFAVVGDKWTRIAELFWNGGEWMFVPLDKDGDPYHGPDREVLPVGRYTSAVRHIDVDPGRRMHLNAIAEENLKGREDRHEAINAAMDAALATRRREFRDDTRDLAELGAKIFARGWYPKWREL